jgi:hypothetical protein
MESDWEREKKNEGKKRSFTVLLKVEFQARESTHRISERS